MATLNIPEWSDMSNVSSKTRDSWLGEITIRNERRRYFTGTVFDDTMPLDTGTEEENPELYPVGVNLVKMLCVAMADSEFGEWGDQVVLYEPSQDGSVTEAEQSACDLANKILRTSAVNVSFWELCLDRNIYGGAPFKISPALNKPGHIKWNRVPLDTFFPIWDPEDPDELLEVYIAVKMTPEQAKQKYSYDGDAKDYVTRIDHYTRTFFDSRLEGKRIDAYSQRNPWGFIPFEYAPRMRTTHWWGDSLTEDLTRVQDELNLRLADLGEAINYNSHPTRWGKNLPASFNTRNYPLGANVLWDMGKTMTGMPEPQVGMLESKNPIPEGTFHYIKFLYDWGRTSVFAPPIAFGEDEGSQRSGITLELRMWPMIKAVRRSRGYLIESIVRGMRKSALILQQKKIGSQWANQRLIDAEVIPTMASIMPRDQAKIVDEVTKRMMTVPPSISVQTATKKLGDGYAEVDRILDQLDNDTFYQRAMPQQEDPRGADGATGMDEEA